MPPCRCQPKPLGLASPGTTCSMLGLQQWLRPEQAAVGGRLPDVVGAALPLFFFLIAVEALAAWRAGRRVYTLRQTTNNLAAGILSVLLGGCAGGRWQAQALALVVAPPQGSGPVAAPGGRHSARRARWLAWRDLVPAPAHAPLPAGIFAKALHIWPFVALHARLGLLRAWPQGPHAWALHGAALLVADAGFYWWAFFSNCAA